jgi:hypothetical protein
VLSQTFVIAPGAFTVRTAHCMSFREVGAKVFSVLEFPHPGYRSRQNGVARAQAKMEAFVLSSPEAV